MSMAVMKEHSAFLSACLLACMLACQVYTEALHHILRVNRSHAAATQISCSSLSNMMQIGLVSHVSLRCCHAAVNARHQAEKRKLQQAMARDNVPPARTSTPGMHTN